MKRKMSLICCLLALTLLSSIAFLACEKKPAGTTYTDPTAEQLELILDMLETDHKKAFSDATPANYELNTIYVFDGKSAAYLQYTVVVDTTGGAKEDDVKVVNSSTDNTCTVEVNSKSKIEVPYTLTATLVNQKGEAYKKADDSLYTVSFTHNVPAYTLVSFEEFVKAADDKSEQTVTVVGYLTGIVSMTSSSKGSMYFVDKQGYGYYAYNQTDATKDITTDEQLRAAWPVGTEIEVSGTATLYNGQYEFNKGCSVTKTGNSITQEELYVYRNATADWSKAVDNQDTALVPYQNALVELNNAKMVSVDGKYYYFTVGGKKFNLYDTNYFMDSDDVKTLLAKFAVGKQATIKGLVSVYSKAYQIYPLGLDAISDVKDATFTDQEMLDSTISEVSVTAEYTEDGKQLLPVKGTAFENVTISWAIKGDAPASVTLVDNKLTVTVGSSVDTVTLVATFTSNGVTETKEYTVKVVGTIDWKNVAFANTEAAKLDGANKETSTETYYFYGTVGEIYDEPYCDFYLVDGEESIIVYGIWDAEGNRYGTKDGFVAIPFKTGDRIFMTGKLQNFGGKFEIVKAVLLEAPEAGTSVVNPMTVEQAIAKCTALAKDNTNSEDKYYVIGTVGEIYNTTYCNFYLVDGDNSLTVFGLTNSEGVKFGSKDDTYTAITIKTGDIVVIYANLQRYVKTSGETKTTTNELTNGTLISVTEAAAEPTEAEKLAAIIAKMSTEVTSDFALDVAATWTVTSGSAIVIENGKAIVTRPAAGEQDATVVLSATLGEATQTVTIIVKALPAVEETEEDIVNAAFALAEGKSLDGEKTLTGVIVDVLTPYNTQFSNITVNISLYEKVIQCFRMKGEGAELLVVGDKIKVTGTIKNYNGTVEFDAGCTFELVHRHTWDEGSVTKEANCTEKGTKVYNCTECSETKTEEIPAIGHKDENADGKCDVCEAEVSPVEESSIAKIVFGKSGGATQESIGSYGATWKATVKNQEWTLTNFNNNSNGWEFIRCGKKKTTDNASISTLITEKAVKKIILNAKFPSTNAQITTLVVNVKNANGDVIETKTIEKADLVSGDNEIVIENATAGCTYEIVFNYSNTTSTNGQIDVYSVEYIG